MRKTFDRQRRLDCPSVTKVFLNLNCRNETIPILRALGTSIVLPGCVMLFSESSPEMSTTGRVPPSGRPGMSYWEILVLAGARLGCGYGYDQLRISPRTTYLRQVMGMGGLGEC